MRDQAYLASHPGRVLRCKPTTIEELARAGSHQSGRNVEERGFAGAVTAEENENFSRAETKRDVAEGGKAAEAFGEDPGLESGFVCAQGFLLPDARFSCAWSSPFFLR